MSYSKIALGLAAGMLVVNVAGAEVSAPCAYGAATACGPARTGAAIHLEWAYVVHPEASHIVYPEGIFVFGDR